ncbi:MAG: hypothetical protein ACAH80_07920 [Alphaproteobacteria bacterium]
MSKGKINLNFKRVAEENLVRVAAATTGQELQPIHGDIPETPEELVQEIERIHVFMKAQDAFAGANLKADDWKAMQERGKELQAQIDSVSTLKSNRKFLGMGGLKDEARREVDKLEAERDVVTARLKAHDEAAETMKQTRAKAIKRLVVMQDRLNQSPEPVVMKAEAPAVTGAAVKKISLNFKRVTGAESEAMAEGTLVTGGFDLPEHKERQRRLQATIEAAERADRRMRAEREEEERRRMEAERRQREDEDRERRRQDEARRRAAEEHQRMSREAERYRSREAERFTASGASSRSSGIGHGGSPMSSRW